MRNFWHMCLLGFAITSATETSLESNNATNSETSTVSDSIDETPWIPSIILEDLRDDKVMKGPSTTIYTNSKFVVNRPPNKDTPQSPTSHEVSETDIYLLNAIEKLAYRFDALEQRLKRTEELIFHIMEGSNIKRQDACPSNFTRVARNCYYFSDWQHNWKSAASTCKKMGSNLLEVESRDEYMEVVTYIQSSNYLRGYEFWTGGLNPGLLWIWANSARPVFPKNPSNRPEDTVVGTGRCLSLAINKAKLYQYQGVDCGQRLRFICEHEENATIRALKRIQKALVLKEGQDN